MNSNVSLVSVEERAQELFEQQCLRVHVRTDRLFALLLLLEWLAGIAVALLVSPLNWAGRDSSPHVHVWTACILGGLTVALPVFLALRQPGKPLTRYSIASGQMLFSALLIHLTGGRIETHFHVFGSLAFLSFYRDWRVLVPATVIVAADHVLRGYYFPSSVYGVNFAEPWRWAEHIFWVLFEVFFLIIACRTGKEDMRLSALRQAEVEGLYKTIDDTVTIRTEELKQAKLSLSVQHAVAIALNKSDTFATAVPNILEAASHSLFSGFGKNWAAFWAVNDDGSLTLSECLHRSEDRLEQFEQASRMLRLFSGQGVPGLVLERRGPIYVCEQDSSLQLPRLQQATEANLLYAAGFPVWCKGKIIGVFEFLTQKPFELSNDLITVFETLSGQTEQYLLRKAADEQRSMLANVVMNANDAILTITNDMIITSWNGGAERMFGYTCEEMTGTNISVLSVPGHEQVIDLTDLIKTGRRAEYETQRLSKQGRVLDVLLSCAPVWQNGGELEIYSIMFHDITERKEAERRVSEFYSTVSHELRTPLTSIRAALGLLEAGKAGELASKAKQLVQVARSESDRLIRLINDILDLKKIEAGMLELRLTACQAGDLMKTTLQSCQSLASEAGVTMRQEVLLDGIIQCDRDRITQVLANLLSNALKFSPVNSEVTVRVDGGKTKARMIRFSIADQGPGIPEDQRFKLFNKFQQLDQSDSRQKGGTGLGLAIAKSIVEAHGGCISLESRQEGGSVFWFELPLAEVLTINAPEQELPFRALLVDDDSSLAIVLQTMLAHEGFGLQHVRTIRDARLQLLEPNLPQVIFLDVNLPDGNGIEFLELLRANQLTSNIPVIMVTGEDADPVHCRNPLLVDCLKKPFEESRLLSALTQSLRITHNSKTTAIVIEDDLPTRGLIVSLLESMSIQCLEAGDGLSAIELARTHKPDLIVLDVGLPDLDGFQIVDILKRDADRPRAMIVYTNSDLSFDECKKLMLGFTRHLTKSRTSDQEFCTVVAELLNGLLTEASLVKE